MHYSNVTARSRRWILRRFFADERRLTSFAELVSLGIAPAVYPPLDDTRTQAIAAAARFLEFDGLLVPSARHPGSNLVLLLDQLAGDGLEVLASEAVDWAAWRAAR